MSTSNFKAQFISIFMQLRSLFQLQILFNDVESVCHRKWTIFWSSNFLVHIFDPTHSENQHDIMV